jgi:hypothetical protein
MKITLSGNTRLVTSACLTKDKHGHELLINTREKRMNFHRACDIEVIIFQNGDDLDVDYEAAYANSAKLKVEFDSPEENFTSGLTMVYESQDKDQILLRWIAYDGYDGVELASARFDGDQQ